MSKEKPILFNADMVNAILGGRKTQTRRAIKNIPSNSKYYGINKFGDHLIYPEDEKELEHFYPVLKCPYGQVGDELWVRETFREWSDFDLDIGCGCSDHCNCNDLYPTKPFCYRADGYEIDDDMRDIGIKWKPSIFMPRNASRIQLRITDIRVERLNDLCDEDAQCEGLRYHETFGEWGGVEPHPSSRKDSPHYRWYKNPVDAFKNLWNSINGNKSWDDNPWVWVVEFEKVN